MRLIDADAFYKQFEEGRDGITMIEALLPSELVDAVIGIYDEIKERLDATPTVDAVEVVRCKDCKFEKDCTQRGFSDDFCSRGRRKDGTD